MYKSYFCKIVCDGEKYNNVIKLIKYIIYRNTSRNTSRNIYNI